MTLLIWSWSQYALAGGTASPNPTIDLLKEEEVVSIATRYEQPLSQAPSNVYVITDEDIRHSGATDLPTVLRRVPGLEVMQMTGGEFNVSARGNNQPFANKMLVMVDGRSIYLDVQGPVFWKALPVTLPEIKRVEVLKGPAAAVYGFNAFDGVINIVTKSAEEMRGTTLQIGGGEYGTITSAAIQAGTIGNLGYRLSIGRDQNQQWRNSDALGFRSHKVNLDSTYRLPHDARLRLSGGLTDVNRFDGQVGEIVQGSIRPTWGYTNLAYEQGDLVVRAWWSGYWADATTTVAAPLTNNLRISDPQGNVMSPFTAHTYNLDVHHSLALGSQHRLMYGANYRYNTLASTTIDRGSHENRVGLFVQDDWRLSSTLSLTAGLRYDLQTEITGTLSPRVALIYSPATNHTFRASVSVAYRPPTLFETHAAQQIGITLPTGLVPPLPTTATNIVPLRGATGLDPEQIVSYEVGYQGWFWNHRLRVRTDLFFNHLDNLMNNRQVSGVATFLNDPGRADIYGGEAGVELLATSWLSTFANVAYQEFDQSFQGTASRTGPHMKVNAGLRGEWDNGLSAETSVFYVGASTYGISQLYPFLAGIPGTGVVTPSDRVGGYTLLNARAGYRVWQERASAGYLRDAELAVSVFNALDDGHREHPLGDMLGRRVMGWLTVRY